MMKKFRRSLWMILGASLGGFLAFLMVSRWESPLVAQGTPSPANPSVVTDLIAVGDRFELVARQVSPAVVYVETHKRRALSSSKGKAVVEESGSGVIVRWPGRSDYLVFTNHHVVADAEPGQVIVQLADGRLLTPVRVWSHPASDVAVLSVEKAGPLPNAPLGDSDAIRVGNWVLAIGSPFGLNQTVTHGILSARERGRISLGEAIHIKDFLQTDAAINPGSSGGPLVNLNGEVIGINTAIASPNGSNSGVAFSIPINLYKRVVQDLLEKGAVSRGYLGIQLASTFEAADALRLGLDRVHGAYVEMVFPETPAAQAGLRVGDMILEFNRTPVRDENHLINMISATAPGQNVPLIVWRDRQRIALSAMVGERATARQPMR